jgi:hypothetical protein
MRIGRLHFPDDTTRRTRCAAVMILMAAALASRPAAAASVSGLAGYEYADAGGPLTRAAFAAGVLHAASFEGTLAAGRYADDQVGAGTSLTAGLELPLAPMLGLRVQGTRLIGDGDYRAWRSRVGPEFTWGGGSTLFLGYLHDESNQDLRSDAALLEQVATLAPGWSARLDASYAANSEGEHGAQAAGGLVWSPLSHLLLSGEVGLSQRAAIVAGAGQPPRRLPLVGELGPGDPGASASRQDFHSTVLLGVRVLFP